MAVPVARAQVVFNPVQFYSSGGTSCYGVAAGDMNGDGRPDLVVANRGDNTSSSNTIGILLASATVPGTFGAVVTYPGGASVGQLVGLGDLNGDSRLDVVVTDPVAGKVLVLLGSAVTPGALQAAIAYDASAVGPNSRQAALGDVNGDGRLDLAVSSFDTGLVGILLNSATAPGTFGAATLYNTGGGGSSAASLTDMNADGRADLVVLDRNNNVVRILAGQATPAGTFGAAVAYSVGGTTPYGLVLGDVNGDGRPDVLTANINSNTVSVLLNSAAAPGTLLPGIIYATGGNGPIELTLGDLNNDGRPDIAVSNQYTNNVGVLLNSAPAPGTFGAAVVFTTGTGPRSVVIVDVNKDNRRDLITANFSSNNLGVLLNQTVLAATPILAAAEATLFPNPAHEGFTVIVPAVADATTVQADLFNALGQRVHQQSAALPAGGTRLAVNTSELAGGVYVLRLAAGAAIFTQRVVVQ